MSEPPGPESGELFPPTSQALEEPNGLLAIGGDLSVSYLLAAYSRGIFPWYTAHQPIMWWTPDPRAILFPEQFHLSRSMRRTLRRSRQRLTVNQDFRRVMQLCGTLREEDEGTWITPDMLRVYEELHDLGWTHSIEVREPDGELVGGLYGLAMGRVFFGESMFSLQRDASKIALAGLVYGLRRAGFEAIDCQIHSEHLASMGARLIPRREFEALLHRSPSSPMPADAWRIPARCGELLAGSPD